MITLKNKHSAIFFEDKEVMGGANQALKADFHLPRFLILVVSTIKASYEWPLFVYYSPGYVRIVLIVIGWFFYDRISVFLPLYAVSTFLDGKPNRLQNTGH